MADVKVRLDLKPDATTVDETTDRFVGIVGGKVLLMTSAQAQELIENTIGLRLYDDSGTAKLQYKNSSGVWTDSGYEWPYE